MHVKELVESKIEMCLSSVKISEGSRAQARRKERENELLEALRRQELIADDDNSGGSSAGDVDTTDSEDAREKERAEWSLLGQNENDVEDAEDWEGDRETSATSTQEASDGTSTTTRISIDQETQTEAEPTQKRAAASGQ